MALQTFFNPVFSGQGILTVLAADSTHISVNFGPANDTYFGSFSYGYDGSVTGGFVTSMQETYNGLVSFTLTGLNVSAPAMATAVLTADTTTQINLVYGGADSIMGSIYGEGIEAGAGNDTVIALDGNDTVDGGAGDDDVNGNKGDDIVVGGDGADTVRGGQGDDTVLGGNGDDGHVNGNIGNDSVSGGAGNDTVYGGQGSDTLHGDAGNDLLSGDLGNDILYGDAGADRFSIARNGGVDWVADFHASEGDKIQLAPGTAYTVINSGGQVMIDLGGGDQLGLAGVAFASFSSDWVVFG
jgi:Ca2+-binding RTX toxin-like protein